MAIIVTAPRMTEPEVVHCHFVEGLSIEIRDEFVRLVGWVDLGVAEDNDPERRIVVRAAMTPTVARALIRDLRKSIGRGGH